MNLSETEITRIVEEVVRQLTGSSTVAQNDSVAVTQNDSVAAGQLRIDSRIVSLETLSGRLDGVNQLIVEKRAVVTPSTRDLLRQQNVSLIRADKMENNTDRPTRRIAVVRHSDKGNIRPEMLQKLSDGQIETVDHSTPCIFKAVDWVIEQISQPETLAVMTTKFTDIALCTANRRAELRAVAIDNPDRVMAAVASVGANLLILPCGSIAQPEFRSAIQQYVEAGPQPCPAPLRELCDRN